MRVRKTVGGLGVFQSEIPQATSAADAACASLAPQRRVGREEGRAIGAAPERLQDLREFVSLSSSPRLVVLQRALRRVYAREVAAFRRNRIFASSETPSRSSGRSLRRSRK